MGSWILNDDALWIIKYQCVSSFFLQLNAIEIVMIAWSLISILFNAAKGI